MEAALFELTPLSLLLITAIVLFALGIGTFVAGIIVLLYRVSGKQIRRLATQTTQLAQTGIPEEIAGLVGNASSLLESVNQLLKTTAGIGVFLCLLSLILVGAASWVFSLCLAGYWLGNMPWVKQNLSVLILGIIVVSLIPVAVGYAKHRAAA